MFTLDTLLQGPGVPFIVGLFIATPVFWDGSDLFIYHKVCSYLS